MKGKTLSERAKLANIAEFLAENVEGLTDEQVAEALADEGIGETDAIELARQSVESAFSVLGARRLELARDALRSSKAQLVVSIPVDPRRAKLLLGQYWMSHPAEKPLTLAARNGGDLSDETAVEMLRSLIELGAIPKEEV